MKKLLSILSVLTISGTAIPTTIAASPYQKEEKLNNNFTKSNLETLNRVKRQNNNITPDVKVSNDGGVNSIKKYFIDLYNAITFLQNNDNVRLISADLTGGFSSHNIFYVNENSNNQYFIMLINISTSNRRISLIFRSNDFYLQGFIGHPISNNETLNVYYYFNDSTITNVSGTIRSQIIPFGSNYTGSNGLRAVASAPIRWANIVQGFDDLANYGENPRNVSNDILRAAFVRVILATAESMSFRQVRESIIINHDTDNPNSNWGWYFNDFLRNWDRISQDALNNLIQLGTLFEFYQLQNITILSKTFSNYLEICKKEPRSSRSLNNNEYCLKDLKSYYKDDKTDVVVSHFSN